MSDIDPAFVRIDPVVGSKTILITNNYKTSTVHGSVRGGAVTGSNITIVTSPPPSSENAVVLDRINICINNHYDGGGGGVGPTGGGPMLNIKKEGVEKEQPPKVAGKFVEGDDVLVKQDDGRFFFGTIKVVAAGQCLIQFDDNTKKWAAFDQLKPFGAAVKEEDSGPMCVVCKKTQKQPAVVCEGCGRGYHPKTCSEGEYGEKGMWFCQRCSAHDETESEPPNIDETELVDPEQEIQTNYIEKLPYNVSNESLISGNSVKFFT